MTLMAKTRNTTAHSKESDPPTRSFTMNMETKLYNVLAAHSKKDRREKKVIIEMALEEFFTKLGLWPPEESDE